MILTTTHMRICMEICLTGWGTGFRALKFGPAPHSARPPQPPGLLSTIHLLSSYPLNGAAMSTPNFRRVEVGLNCRLQGGGGAILQRGPCHNLYWKDPHDGHLRTKTE